jgi:RNA recognition motif-containing protein
MTDRDLNELFRPLRKIVDVRVAIDRRTGQPRGFAHADFLDVDAAKEGRRTLEGMVVHGRELKVNYAFTKEKPGPKKTLAELIADEQSATEELSSGLAEEADASTEPISQPEAEGIEVSTEAENADASTENISQPEVEEEEEEKARTHAA